MDVKLETDDCIKDFLKVIEEFDEVFADYEIERQLTEAAENRGIQKIVKHEYTRNNHVAGGWGSLEYGGQAGQEI